ncbi:hypothetical protein [Frankia sp. AgB32]|uniref:hypothetical protein n=1 Tax=Frankia sp. AgB32 TaxID=631119 RepID=UPI00200D8375|nr:hypothetical protein [Frankia sp. AgB32]MCK9894880.1 hypothetical protein [Frankia sp. AgB32]
MARLGAHCWRYMSAPWASPAAETWSRWNTSMRGIGAARTVATPAPRARTRTTQNSAGAVSTRRAGPNAAGRATASAATVLALAVLAVEVLAVEVPRIELAAIEAAASSPAAIASTSATLASDPLA